MHRQKSKINFLQQHPQKKVWDFPFQSPWSGEEWNLPKGTCQDQGFCMGKKHYDLTWSMCPQLCTRVQATGKNLK